MNGSIKIIHFSITSNRTDQTFTANYPATMTITEFKIKLELIVGTYRQDMRLQLRDVHDKLLAEIVGDTRTLEQVGLADGHVVHVIDVAHPTPAFSDSDASEKFVLSDEKYGTRKESVRKWKQELGVVTPQTYAESVPENFKIGARCEVVVPNAPVRLASIAYIGDVHFKPGVWVGVCYDDAVGKNDGSIDGHSYFETKPQHGGFVQPKAVNIVH